MTKELVKFFTNFPFLNEEDIDALLSITCIKKYSKGELIYEANKIDSNYYIILKGLVNQFFQASSGEFKSFHFAPEMVIIGAVDSFYNKLPSRVSAEAIEDCEIAIFSSEKTSEIIEKNPRLLLLENRLIKKSLYDLHMRVLFFASLTPEERYLQIVTKEPELFQRVPQKLIASYIGISEVSLSRIKSRLK
jgi:CRP-like cAMP-binding protein